MFLIIVEDMRALKKIKRSKINLKNRKSLKQI